MMGVGISGEEVMAPITFPRGSMDKKVQNNESKGSEKVSNRGG